MTDQDMKTAGLGILATGVGFVAALPLATRMLADPASIASAVAAISLLAAAGVTLLRPPARRADAASTRLRPEAGAYPAIAEAPALSPEAWLGRHSALSLPEFLRGPAIQAGLSAQLGQASLDDRATRLLLHGIRTHGAGRIDGTDAGDFLEALAAAMRLPPAPREAALDRLSRGLPAMRRNPAHAFVETAFLADFEDAHARTGLASASFSWLRFHRRGLWFALNNLGRPTRHVEGLGPIVHYGREKEAGGPIEIPYVDEAAGWLCDLAREIEGKDPLKPLRDQSTGMAGRA